MDYKKKQHTGDEQLSAAVLWAVYAGMLSAINIDDQLSPRDKQLTSNTGFDKHFDLTVHTVTKT
ncbi:MAG: hypothetical protein KUG67_02120 [Proteobacteria bacterium]|nr:hypothetical protein [Pseudomonadota bacterium]